MRKRSPSSTSGSARDAGRHSTASGGAFAHRHDDPRGERLGPVAQPGRRTVTALFADAVGSTSLGETHDEEVVFELMRACVERMTATVQRHDGVVTQFLGDGSVAPFGAPTAFEGGRPARRLPGRGVDRPGSRLR